MLYCALTLLALLTSASFIGLAKNKKQTIVYFLLLFEVLVIIYYFFASEKSLEGAIEQLLLMIGFFYIFLIAIIHLRSLSKNNYNTNS